ncbi:MAG: hypothetical protein ACOCRO_05570 [Halanaerobiales bacterium]
MDKERVHEVMKESNYKTFEKIPGVFVDLYHSGCFQIYYNSNSQVKYIELSEDIKNEFEVVYKEKNVFKTKVKDLITYIEKEVKYDREDPEVGCSYIFPEIDMSLWRPVIDEEVYDCFESIGVGKEVTTVIKD